MHALPHIRDRLKTVVICHKVPHGRAFLKSCGWPLSPPLPAPAVATFSWAQWWAYGHPPPLLVVDPQGELRPEDVQGADLTVEVWFVLRENRKIRHVIARPFGQPAPGLLDRLRRAGLRDAWQPAHWQRSPLSD